MKQKRETDRLLFFEMRREKERKMDTEEWIATDNPLVVSGWKKEREKERKRYASIIIR